MDERAPAAAVTVVPVTPDRWPDLVDLFERPGPRGGMPIPGSCWCMAWRGRPPSRAARKQAMEDLVSAGREPGLLAYVDGVPMGWAAIAPRDDHVGSGRSRLFPPADGDSDGEDGCDGGGVFAITCFYIDPNGRGEGLASALMDAAIDYARERGATAVEAYPKASLPPHAAAATRAEQNESFMGRRSSFERRGFVPVRDAGARIVMRCDLTAGGR